MNRNKVDEIFTACEQIFNRRFFCAVNKIRFIAENFVEVFIPADIDNGAVRDDYGFFEVKELSDLQGAESFAETHFSIPEKIVVPFKIFDGNVNCVELFGTEIIIRKFFGNNFASAVLDDFNSFNRLIEVNFKPFATGRAFEFFTIFFQQAVNIIIAENSSVVSHSKFCV